MIGSTTIHAVQARVLRYAAVFLFAFICIALRPAPAEAAVNLSLTPATGTYSTTFTIGFYVNANPATDQIAGISVDINYTGPISYASYTDGASNCNVQNIVPAAGTVHLECFADFNPGYISGPGTVANLTFTTTGVGAASMQIEVIEIGYVTGTLGTVTGGTYAISAGGGNLPDTGIFDTPILVGSVILMGTAGLFVLSRKDELLGNYGSHSRVVIKRE